MILNSKELAILKEARKVSGIMHLKPSEIVVCRTGRIKRRKGARIFRLRSQQVNIAIKREA